MPTRAEPSPQLVISLDASDLGASVAFYRGVLGFEQIGAEREGMIFESRTLAHGDWPAMHLRLRAAFGRRPIGSSGGMLALSLRVPADALAGRIAGLVAKSGVRWIGSAPVAPFADPRVRLADPDGYVIELFA